MTHLIRVSKRLTSLAFVALAACTAPESSPTALAPSEEPLAGKQTASAYTVLDLGTMGGLSDIQGSDVNNEGVVAGTAQDESSSRGFLLLGGQLVPLTQAEDSWASGISNGDPMYVVGAVSVNGAMRRARWTVSGGTIGAPVLSPVSGGAWKVNDFGVGVGGEYIWHPNNSVILVAPPGDFLYINGRDINDAGLTLFVASGSPTLPDRAFLRLTDGSMVRLDPPGGGESYSTSVGGLNEPDGNGIVHVAGTIQVGGLTRYPARWTVNVNAATPQATVFVDSRIGFATDVSSAGTRVGAEGGAAYVWRLDASKFKLPAPRGAQDVVAQAISDNGRYATGGYYGSRGGRRALLWSGNGP